MTYLDTTIVAVICYNIKCDYKGQRPLSSIPRYPNKFPCPDCGFKTAGDARFYEEMEEG